MAELAYSTLATTQAVPELRAYIPPPPEQSSASDGKGSSETTPQSAAAAATAQTGAAASAPAPLPPPLLRTWSDNPFLGKVGQQICLFCTLCFVVESRLNGFRLAVIRNLCQSFFRRHSPTLITILIS